MKGGKKLGEGGFGCVVEPYYPCSKKKSKIDVVSKLIVKDDKMIKEILDEYKISLKLKKIDPNNNYFLGGIEKCDIKFKKLKKEDINSCYILNEKNKKYINIIMPKGEDFKNIIPNMTPKNVLISLKNLLKGAKLLNEKGITFLDIKYENLLFVRNSDNKNEIHPVFIDFSKYFVIKNKKEFKKFLKLYKGSVYQIWPVELLIFLFVMNDKTLKKNYIEIKKHFENMKIIESIVGFKPNVEAYYNIFKEELKNNYKLTLQRIMIYLIGMSFLDVININDKFLKKILEIMTDNDFRRRKSVDELIKMINNKLKINSNSKIDISKDKSLNKMKKKTFRKKNLFNFFRNKKKSKKTKRISKNKKNISKPIV